MIMMQGRLPLTHAPSAGSLGKTCSLKCAVPLPIVTGLVSLQLAPTCSPAWRSGSNSRRGAVMSGLGGRREPVVAREGVVDVAVAGRW